MNDSQKKITIVIISALLLIAAVLVIYFFSESAANFPDPTITKSPYETASPYDSPDQAHFTETPSPTSGAQSPTPSNTASGTKTPSISDGSPTPSDTGSPSSTNKPPQTNTIKPSTAKPSPTKSTPSPTKTSTPTPSKQTPTPSPSQTPSVSPSPSESLSPEQEIALLECRALVSAINDRTGVTIKFEKSELDSHNYVSSSLSVNVYTDYIELLNYIRVLDNMLSEEKYPSSYWETVKQYTNGPTILLGKNIKKDNVSMGSVYGVTAWNTGKRNCDIFLLVCNNNLRNSGEAERIAHHEMFHFIEYVLIIKKPAAYNGWTAWTELNPMGFAYNSSIDIGQGEDDKLKTSSLISWYAGTLASEDRAEIFSYMCMDSGEPSLFRLSAAAYDPYIKEKANYLAQTINTELGLSNTIWEAGAAAMNNAVMPDGGIGNAITKNAIRLRESTLRNGISIVTIPQGVEVIAHRYSNQIMQIEYNGHIGYCDTSDIIIDLVSDSNATEAIPSTMLITPAALPVVKSRRKRAA